MSAPSLKTLQLWMSTVVQHPKTAFDAIRSPRARTLVTAKTVLAGGLVAPSATMTPAARLDVYNGGYLTRLVEAIESDYRGVSAVLGHGEFHRLVARFVVRHPSRHPNLNRFGKELPDFLRKHLADRRAPFLAELARLERTMTFAFDAPEFTPLSEVQLQSAASGDLARLVLVPNPSLHVERFAWPVDPFLAEILERDRVPPLPRKKVSEVAVFRNQGRVWRATLGRAEAKVLRALCAGKPLGIALSGAKAAPRDVAQWFARWSGEGFFVAAES